MFNARWPSYNLVLYSPKPFLYSIITKFIFKKEQEKQEKQENEKSSRQRAMAALYRDSHDPLREIKLKSLMRNKSLIP